MSIQRAFACLRPDPIFTRRLVETKTIVRDRVGSQLYLDHPPHLTLYLSSFPCLEDVRRELASLAEEIATPRVEVVGWHVFSADPLTGGVTLVCRMDDEGVKLLRTIQKRIVERLSPLRHPATARDRFAANRAALSDAEWASVEKWGFPYVGGGWIPHFTVASVKARVWGSVWDAVGKGPLLGSVKCPEIVLCSLDDGYPVEVDSFSLRGRSYPEMPVQRSGRFVQTASTG